MPTIADVRAYNGLKGVEDSEIEAHLQSAMRDFSPAMFGSNEDYIEAVAYQTIINVAPILWARGMTNFPGYETIYARYADIDAFTQSYKKRLQGVIDRNAAKSGGFKYGAV